MNSDRVEPIARGNQKRANGEAISSSLLAGLVLALPAFLGPN